MPGPVIQEEAFALNPLLEAVWRRQWMVDPPFLRQVNEEIMAKVRVELVRLHADLAVLESQATARYAQFMKNTAELVGHR